MKIKVATIIPTIVGTYGLYEILTNFIINMAKYNDINETINAFVRLP